MGEIEGYEPHGFSDLLWGYVDDDDDGHGPSPPRPPDTPPRHGVVANTPTKGASAPHRLTDAREQRQRHDFSTRAKGEKVWTKQRR